MVLCFSFVLLNLVPAFAVITPDSTPWTTAKTNYAAVTVRVTDCTPYGNDSTDNDSICNNWEVNSGPNAGLNVDFTDSTLGVGNPTIEYKYILPCTPVNTI